MRPLIGCRIAHWVWWWFAGNFLLDGHHNGGWDDGSFDLQLVGSGRVRWLFGDGELRGVQAYPSTNEGGNFVEDSKGTVSELRFWSLALDASLLENNHARAIAGDESGLVGWYRFGEGSGTQACDELAPASCFDLVERDAPIWSTDLPPLQ